MGSSKPAVSGALVDINILQINVHSHHAPARQENTINPAVEALRMSVQSELHFYRKWPCFFLKDKGLGN